MRREKLASLMAVRITMLLVFGLFLVFSSYAIAGEKGLVGYWKIDEGKGTIAKDSSGKGNNGQIHNAIWVKGESGNALSFNGVNDYVEISNDSSLDITSAITIETWVKTSTTQVNKYIVSKPAGTRANGWDLNTGAANNKLYLSTRDISPDYFEVDANIYDNVWHHIVGTYDGAKHYIFIDGVLIASQDATGTIGINTNNLYIGKFGNYGAYFNGEIGEVRIYNKSLTDKEIKKHFEAGRSRLSNHLF